ncbi:APC family permease [uncultured Micrococcus sp.]|uniref:APC family permease n=1 Tax=uncultured Micrococcus sp. TaxID=114051 RepID=UPI00130E7B06|nr:APC family permease [uncultured Micrococcus sp.]
MSTIVSTARRLLLGRPVAFSGAPASRVSRMRALPVFSSNAFSSLAYAPDEIILTLVATSSAALVLGPAIGWSVVVIMLVIVASFRAALVAVPRGGIYEMARTNLGPRSGVVASAALLLDLVFMVAVSLAAFSQYVVALVPALRGSQLWLALGALALLVLAALRGAGFRGRLTAVCVHVFVVLMLVMLVLGFVQDAEGSLSAAPTAEYTVQGAGPGPVEGIALAFLVLRAFSSGSALLTGLEVPVASTHRVRRPAVPAVRWILTVMALTGAILILGVAHLAARTGVVVVLDVGALRDHQGRPVPEAHAPAPVVAQLAEVVFGDGSPAAVVLVGAVAALLLVTAHAAFSSFPALSARLAEGGYVPRQLKARGDRLVHSWAILALGAAAAILLCLFQARTAYLVQLYVIGVFLAFTLALAGMLRLWRRRLAHTPDSSGRSAVRWRLALTALALALTAVAGVVVLATRFAQGAWVALLAIFAGAFVMGRVHAHYAAVAKELRPEPDDDARALPARVHGVVVLSSLNRPALRALAYARASRPATLEAVVVDVERENTESLLHAWEQARIPVPLTIVGSPYRDAVTPLVRHLRRRQQRQEAGLTMVYLPEFVVRAGWRSLLHNRTAARLSTRLQREPDVMVAQVPWQIRDGQRQRTSG